MANVRKNPSNMTLPELVQLRGKIDGLIKVRVADERDHLQARLDELKSLAGNAEAPPKGNGYGHTTRRRARAASRKTIPPKYRGPSGETWSGRGLTPRWLAALEKTGKKRDAFLIHR